MRNYGKELILDIHKCEDEVVFNRVTITAFFKDLCAEIDMERCDLYFWDYEGELEEYNKAPAHLKGTSAVQFISTSNVTIHALDEMRRVYINVFSCKDFDSNIVKRICIKWFGGVVVHGVEVDRL